MNGQHPGDRGFLFAAFYDRLGRELPGLTTDQRLAYTDLAVERWVLAVQPLLLGIHSVVPVAESLGVVGPGAPDAHAVTALAALDTAAVARRVAAMPATGRARLEVALRGYEDGDGGLSAMEADLDELTPAQRVGLVVAACQMLVTSLGSSGLPAGQPGRTAAVPAHEAAAVQAVVEDRLRGLWRSAYQRASAGPDRVPTREFAVPAARPAEQVPWDAARALLREALDDTGGRAAVRAFERAPVAVGDPRGPGYAGGPVPPRPAPGSWGGPPRGPSGPPAWGPPGVPPPRSPVAPVRGVHLPPRAPLHRRALRRWTRSGLNVLLAGLAVAVLGASVAVMEGVDLLGDPLSRIGRDTAALAFCAAVAWLIVLPWWGTRSRGGFTASLLAKGALLAGLAGMTVAPLVPLPSFAAERDTGTPYDALQPARLQEAAQWLAAPAPLDEAVRSAPAVFEEQVQRLLSARLTDYAGRRPEGLTPEVAAALQPLVDTGAVSASADRLDVTGAPVDPALWQRLYAEMLADSARTGEAPSAADPLAMALHWRLQGYQAPADRAPEQDAAMRWLLDLGDSGNCLPGDLGPSVERYGVPAEVLARHACA
jgi:hypothetical protein